MDPSILASGGWIDSDSQSGLLMLIYQSVEQPEQLAAALAALASLAGAESARLMRTRGDEPELVASGNASNWSGPQVRRTTGGDDVGIRILPLFEDYELVLDHCDPAPERIAPLVRLAPHLARALRLTERLALRSSAVLLTSERLDRLPFGVALLDERKQVMLLNRPARALTRPDQPLDVREGRLVPRAAVARALFDTLLDQTTRSLRGKRPRGVGGRMSLPMLGRVGADLITVPLRAPTEVGECASAVLLFSPRLHARDPESFVAARFGLPSEEAETAVSLLAGRNPLDQEGEAGVEASRRRLHAVFDKLGTTRQQDLLRMLLEPVAAVEGGATPDA